MHSHRTQAEQEVSQLELVFGKDMLLKNMLFSLVALFHLHISWTRSHQHLRAFYHLRNMDNHSFPNLRHLNTVMAVVLPETGELSRWVWHAFEGFEMGDQEFPMGSEWTQSRHHSCAELFSFYFPTSDLGLVRLYSSIF